MVTRTDPTVLRLEGQGVPPYSARGLTQTLEVIDARRQIERSINGELIDMGYEPFEKYKSTITGSDQQPPAVEGVWPGKVLIVDCIVELCVDAIVMDFTRDPVDYDVVRVENGFRFYRPRLHMRVFDWSIDHDEYGAQIGWKMDLEEI